MLDVQVLQPTGGCIDDPLPDVRDAIGGPFQLTDQHGKTVTEKSLKGKPTLIFFGFTHCPDVCPAELQVMADALGQLGPKAAEILPVFITLDPERDTPKAVGAYVKNFGPNFVVLTGSPVAIAAAAKAYRQNVKARARNIVIKNQLKKLAVKLRKAQTAKKVDDIKAITRDLVRAYDRAAQKKVITRYTAARKKARLAAALRRV